MNYISISQAASKFNVSERYVRRLCNEGMIAGAAKIGQTWILPEDASIENKRSINIILGGLDNVGLEISKYLIDRGEKVCFISNNEKQILKAVNLLGNTNAFLYNIDASDENELIKIRNTFSKYRISKLIFAENNGRFDKAEHNNYNTILQNFRAPIYASVAACSVFYPLMSQTCIIPILHEKATNIGLPNESVFSAAYHGMNGFFDSLIKATENDDKVSHVLKVYTGAIESEFWYSNDAKNVLKLPAENRITPRDLAKIVIDSANSINTLAISEIYVRRVRR